MAADEWERRRRNGLKDGPQDWMTPFERMVCDKNHHGFTKKDLAKHGIPWPAPAGWRKAYKAMIFDRGPNRVINEPLREPPPAPQPKPKPKEHRSTLLSSYDVDRQKLDLAGFAETASLRVDTGPSGTVVVEQSGFFAVSMHAADKAKASRYIVVKKRAIPDLIKRLRSLA